MKPSSVSQDKEQRSAALRDTYRLSGLSWLSWVALETLWALTCGGKRKKMSDERKICFIHWHSRGDLWIFEELKPFLDCIPCGPEKKKKRKKKKSTYP